MASQPVLASSPPESVKSCLFSSYSLRTEYLSSVPVSLRTASPAQSRGTRRVLASSTPVQARPLCFSPSLMQLAKSPRHSISSYIFFLVFLLNFYSFIDIISASSPSSLLTSRSLIGKAGVVCILCGQRPHSLGESG
ncbi:hypothetical protein M440DRAFT_319325 [Trichoderma longibrachiatum ATCC 18648]|uniref:Uncharacterized protein n=1 Tax=Trichoderma longibrachiatum ATCC 18648 TaxID=983965 RepID=A0A2T4C468_TRILO|nr:hypothetical protein M440DRAFT_319325 [Trichoderma longibrachiatum ATCC 18648]